MSNDSSVERIEKVLAKYFGNRFSFVGKQVFPKHVFYLFQDSVTRSPLAFRAADSEADIAAHVRNSTRRAR